MATLKTKLVKLEDIKPYHRNTKRHPPEQIAIIRRSIEAYGFDQPLVLDGEGTIIKGHGRYGAALEMQLAAIPCVVRTDLTPEQANAARIADNRTAISDFDMPMLKLELAELAALDVDLLPLGFTELELLTLSDDEAGEETKRTIHNAGSPVISYTVVFETDNDQQLFFEMVNQLQDKYPERTIGECFADYARDTFGE